MDNNELLNFVMNDNVENNNENLLFFLELAIYFDDSNVISHLLPLISESELDTILQ